MHVKPLVFSYTMLHTYDNICPYQAAQRYVYKVIPFQETEAMRHGNEVHAAMQKRVGRGTPLPATMPYESFALPLDSRGARCEQQIGVTKDGKATGFFDADVYFRCKIDVNIVKGPTAYLLDYKTGKVREEPFELECQAVALHAKNPGLTKVIGQYAWLASNRLGPMHDVSYTGRTWQRIRQLGDQIETDRRMGSFEKREGPLCGWCPCMDCEFNPNR